MVLISMQACQEEDGEKVLRAERHGYGLVKYFLLRMTYMDPSKQSSNRFVHIQAREKRCSGSVIIRGEKNDVAALAL